MAGETAAGAAGGAARAGRTPLERLYAATAALGGAHEDELALVRRVAVELAALLDARYAASASSERTAS